jgi:hypothetical protein
MAYRTRKCASRRRKASRRNAYRRVRRGDAPGAMAMIQITNGTNWTAPPRRRRNKENKIGGHND